MKERPTTHRSGLFILSYQIEGICTTLRYIVPSGLPVGPDTVAMLLRLKRVFERIASGETVENFPDINVQSAPCDILMVAEILRATLLAFLSPEEVEEHRGAFGFRPPDDRAG